MLNRREFIKTSGALTAGMLTASSPLIGAISNTSGINPIGLQAWSIAKFLQQDFKGNLKLLSQIGYKQLELFGPYPFSSQMDNDRFKAISPMIGFSQSGYFNHDPKEFKKILADNGITTTAMHVGLDTLRNKLGETAEAAHILGQQYAGIASIPDEERSTLDDYKRMADEFNVIGEKAKKLGIRFYYHNHGYGLQEIDGKVPFDLILERTDPALVFFEMDIFWHTAGGADPIKYLDRYAGRFKLMHVKDMTKLVRFSGDGGNAQQWIDLFPYITDVGSGVLDLKTILSHARKSGVDHFIIENDVITDPKQSLQKAFTYMSTVVLEG